VAGLRPAEFWFDLRTGAVDAPPAELPVRVHAAAVVNGEVWVTLSEEVPNLPPGSNLGPGLD
jgi:3-phenylpropionate/trans-cinnamate dioxygenase ferredoxin subunit